MIALKQKVTLKYISQLTKNYCFMLRFFQNHISFADTIFLLFETVEIFKNYLSILFYILIVCCYC